MRNARQLNLRGYRDCPVCRGRGWRLIQGGTNDEQISDVCDICEERAVTGFEDRQYAEAVALDAAEQIANGEQAPALENQPDGSRVDPATGEVHDEPVEGELVEDSDHARQMQAQAEGSWS